MAGFPTFASSVPSAPPLPLSSLPPWLRRLQMDVHSGDWIAAIPVPPWMLAVLVSITASTFTVAGFVLQKKALHDPGRRLWPKLGNVVLSPGWIVGFLLTALLPVLGDLVAYSLAPLSLTTPLSGVSVVLNMVIAPWALSEKLQRFPDVPATVLILLGCLLTTMFGDHDRTGPFNLEDLIQLAMKANFRHCVFIGVVCQCMMIWYMRTYSLDIEKCARERPENPYILHVVMTALSAALCGVVANIGLKAIGELIKAKSSKPQIFGCVLLVAPAALMQVNVINRGLFLFPQTVFLSVYGALLVLANTMYGALFYEEYVTLLSSISHCAFFSNGCLIIVIGICLFSRRQPNGNAYATDDEKTGLLDLPDMAGDNTPRDAMGSAGGRERVARSGLKERAERDLDEL